MTKTFALSSMERAALIQDVEFAATATKALLRDIKDATAELSVDNQTPMSEAKQYCSELDKCIRDLVAKHKVKIPDFTIAAEAAVRVVNHTSSMLDLTKRRGLRVGRPYLHGYKLELVKSAGQLASFLEYAKSIPVKGIADALSGTVVSLAADAKKVDALIKETAKSSKNPVFVVQMNIVPPFTHFYVDARKFALHNLRYDRVGSGDDSDFVVLRDQMVLVVDTEVAEAAKMNPLELAMTMVEAMNAKMKAMVSSGKMPNGHELALVTEEHASLKGNSQFTFFWVVPLPTLHLLQPIIGMGTLTWGLAG